MKIVVATGSFGGPVSYSRLLESRLPSHGVGVTVVSFGEVLHLPKLVRHVVYTLRLIKEAKGAQYFYAQDPVSVGLPVYIASLVTKKPYFLKIVGDYAWEQAQARFGVTDTLETFVQHKKRYNVRVTTLTQIELFVAKNARKIIVPSQYLKTIVTLWGVIPEKIEVIYNAFNAPVISESKEALRDLYAYTYPTIVSAGRLVPWKEFPTLITAFAGVLKEYKEAKLYIVDDGPERRRLLDLTRELGIEDSVVFMGKIPQAELHKRIKAADLFVLVSSYEGFSHVLLEALALATPVVASRAGGNPELIEDMKEGLLVPARDSAALTIALKNICSDTLLQTKVSVAGKRKLELFKEEDMIAKLLTVLV